MYIVKWIKKEKGRPKDEKKILGAVDKSSSELNFHKSNAKSEAILLVLYGGSYSRHAVRQNTDRSEFVNQSHC